MFDDILVDDFFDDRLDLEVCESSIRFVSTTFSRIFRILLFFDDLPYELKITSLWDLCLVGELALRI